MSNKKVSVLIPIYNAEKYISETIECILRQSYHNIEVIIIDDGSVDNSYKIAKRYESYKIKVFHQENKGGCKARNLAFEQSTGDYIQYLDGDDLLSEDKIQKQIELLISNNDKRAISICPWRRFNQYFGDYPEEKSTVFHSYKKGIELLIDFLNGYGMMAVHSYLTPRILIEEAGPWDENLKMNQDGEFFSRVLINANKIHFCSEPIAWYRSGLQHSITGKMSIDKCHSKLLALQKIKKTLLEHIDNNESRIALIKAFSNLAYECNLVANDCTKEALKEIHNLGGRGKLDKPPIMSMATRYFGLNFSLKLKRILSLI